MPELAQGQLNSLLIPGRTPRSSVGLGANRSPRLLTDGSPLSVSTLSPLEGMNKLQNFIAALGGGGGGTAPPPIKGQIWPLGSRVIQRPAP